MNKYLFIAFMTFSFPVLSQERGLYHIETGEDLTAHAEKFYSPNRTLFGGHKIFEFTIVSDFWELKKHKNEDDYLDAIYKLKLNDSVEVVNNMRIKARGNFRKSRCTFPPLKLNFKKTEFFSDATDNLKTLKVVSICQKGQSAEQLILKEYLVYRMLNILTDKSFKVRLLKIHFEDTGKKSREGTSYGFIIEDDDEVARRNNAVELKMDVPNQDLTETEHLNLINTFQFMIGNTDYGIPVRHNIKIIKSKDPTLPRPYVLAYDFDMAGIIDAPYAAPNPILPIEDVKTRLFRGLCRQPEAMEPTFELFRSKKDEFLELINSFELLSDYSRRDMINYIESFYDIIDRPKDTERYFTVNCD